MARLKDLLSVLIVSGGESARHKLYEKLDQAVFDPVSFAKSAQEARQLLLHGNYDIVIINAPLPSEIGHELALDIVENTNSQVLLLIKSESYDETRYRVEDAGVITLAKPFSSDMFDSAVNIAIATHHRIEKIEEENKRLRLKLEEIRLVNRAKWVLVENCAMNEEAAHKYIEKTAMDKRLTRYAVSKQILKEYDG